MCRSPSSFAWKRPSPTSSCTAAQRTIGWRSRSRWSATAKRWWPGSRITAGSSTRPRCRRRRMATSLEDAKIGDLGIHLMRSFASGMHYERRGGRNRLTLRFLEPQATRPSRDDAGDRSTSCSDHSACWSRGASCWRTACPCRSASAHSTSCCCWCSRHGELVTKDELMAEVWPGIVVEENNIQVHVSALRKVLGSAGDGERYLLTVAGRGYRFVAPVERESAAPAETAPHRSEPGAAAAARPRDRGRRQQSSATADQPDRPGSRARRDRGAAGAVIAW